ncbi:MAG TPA: hypothetical protein VKE98_13610, partial [Gemmataceae bacterium]|nr:hypothetical protein [Gemmataceae bacterium]
MSFRSYLMSRFPLRGRKTQPARRKPYRPRLEALEDRITPAFASVNVTFQNLTPSILTLVDQPDPDHGTYVNPQPPATINPGATANWRTESSGTLTGTEAHLTYQIGNDPTLQTTLHWDVPTAGDNSADESGPAGYVVEPITGPNGEPFVDDTDITENNNVTMVFAIMLDADGDGIPDVWETNGIDVNGDGTIDLQLNTSPTHKDLFVEADAMTGFGPVSTTNSAANPIITAITNTSPIQVTMPGHGLTTGQQITLSGVGGNVAANNTPANPSWTVNVLDANNFTLNGSNGTASGAFVAGTGTWGMANLVGTGLATNTSLDLVVSAFFNAPVSNPDGTNGINLHVLVDSGDQNLTPASWPSGAGNPEWTSFDNAKTGTTQANFGFGTDADRASPNAANILAAKRLVYRYCIFANARTGTGSSGISEIGGNDFMVTLGAGTTEDAKAATFMHEFGHTLGLLHGGDQNTNYKPNYLSIMNYTWQFRSSAAPAVGTPARNFWNTWSLNYSAVALPNLDEQHLNEANGLGGTATNFTAIGPVTATAAGGGVTFSTPRFVSMSGPIDWNNNGTPNEPDVSADINYLPVNGATSVPASDGLGTDTGFNDWANLQYNFRYNAQFKDGDHSNTETDSTSNPGMAEDLIGALRYVVPAGTGPDSLTLRLNGATVEIFDNNTQTVVASRALNQTTVVQVIGAAGEDDSLTIDYTFGGFFAVSSIQFVGGSGGNNTMRIIGTGQTFGSYTPGAVSGAGMVKVTQVNQSVSISFSGLQPLEVTGMSAFQLVTPSTNNQVTVNTGTGSGGQPAEVITGTSGGVAFESLTFFGIPAFTLDTKTNDGGSPNDVINVQATLAGTTTTISEGGGSNIVNVGSLAPATGGIVNNINGPLVVTSDPGATLSLDDTGSSGPKTGYLTSNTITGLGMAGGITYSGMKNVNVNLGTGNDIFNIQSTSAITTVNGGAAFDVFNVGTLAPESGGYLAQLAGAVFLNGATGGTTTANFDDQLDPADETLTLTNTTFASPISALVTYIKVQKIGVNAGTGNDTLVVDSSAGLVNVANGINYDGGTGFNTLQLIQTSDTEQTSDVYNPGPNPGQGKDTITGGGSTQTVSFQHLAPVLDNVPATTTSVTGTPTNNAIGYVQGPGGAIFTGNTGLVTVDNLESYEFNNKTNLVLNGNGGTDAFSLNNASTPASLTSITVNGGDPTTSNSLSVHGTAATVSVATDTNTITGAGPVSISYVSIVSLAVTAGPSTNLAVSGS